LLVCPSCGTQAQIGPVAVMERDPVGRYHSAAALKWRAEHKEPPLQQQPEFHSLRPDYRSRLRHDPAEGIWLVCL